MIHKIKGIALHHIRLRHEKKSVTIDGQIIVKRDDNDMLKYNNYEDVDKDVQYRMTKWLTKNSSPRL